MIRPAGFYKNKAKSIKEVSKIILKKGKVPNNEEELKALPGVGQKTADITICYGFGRPVIAVDTHVFRISRRIGLARGNIKQVKKQLEEKIPKRYKRRLNHVLVRYGQNICLPRIPRCGKCVVERLCEKNGVERWK
jgi:endonuclease-3